MRAAIEGMDGIAEESLRQIRSNVTAYIDRFHGRDKETNAAVLLKRRHTERVAVEALRIARDLNLSPSQCRLAEATALLHDVGRFRQYTEYGTFVDGKSVNHARLGAEEIVARGFLEGLQSSAANLIINAVAYHNVPRLPPSRNRSFLFLLQLLRDADKIDILHVVTGYYLSGNGRRNRALELDLPDTPEISDAVYRDITEGRIARVAHMRTLSDFKVLQMAWIFDINMKYSFAVIKKRNYLEKIHASMPPSEKADGAYRTARAYLERNVQR